MSRAIVHVPTGIQLLLVEDNVVAAQAVRELLAEGRPRFSVQHAPSLADAIERLASGRVEVVLLDLGLPDSEGLKTLERTRAAAPDLPIVVLTGVEYEEMALAALGQGADDYLFKGEFDRQLLVRSVRYSMERRQIVNDLEQTQHRRALRRELRLLAEIAPPPGAAPASPPLLEREPLRFAELAQRYDSEVGATAHRDAEPRDVAALVADLARLRATSQDVVAIHARSLRAAVDLGSAQETEQRVEAARVLVVEVLGRLAAAYAAVKRS